MRLATTAPSQRHDDASVTVTLVGGARTSVAAIAEPGGLHTLDLRVGTDQPAHHRPCSRANTTATPEIYVLTLATGERRRLTNNPAGDRFPAFSPDGGTIVSRATVAPTPISTSSTPTAPTSVPLTDTAGTDWLAEFSPVRRSDRLRHGPLHRPDRHRRHRSRHRVHRRRGRRLLPRLVARRRHDRDRPATESQLEEQTGAAVPGLPRWRPRRREGPLLPGRLHICPIRHDAPPAARRYPLRPRVRRMGT